MDTLNRKDFNQYTNKNGETLVNDEAWYDIVSYSVEGDLEDRINRFHEHLSSKEWDSWLQALYAHPAFKQQETDRLFEYEIYLSKTSPPEDKVPCPKCGSSNVVVSTSQKRALDEAGSADAVCRNCGKKFHPE